MRSAGFGEGSGSILLDNLMCDGHESSLLECVSSDQIGLHDCEHNEDAGVRCEGMYASFIAHMCTYMNVILFQPPVSMAQYAFPWLVIFKTQCT